MVRAGALTPKRRRTKGMSPEPPNLSDPLGLAKQDNSLRWGEAPKLPHGRENLRCESNCTLKILASDRRWRGCARPACRTGATQWMD
jgi:hypothetical protein